MVGEGGIEPRVRPPLRLWTRVLQTPKGNFTRRLVDATGIEPVKGLFAKQTRPLAC